MSKRRVTDQLLDNLSMVQREIEKTDIQIRRLRDRAEYAREILGSLEAEIQELHDERRELSDDADYLIHEINVLETKP